MTGPYLEVAAAVVLRGDRVLVARRTRPAELAGKWEFAGGKLEPGEGAEACLVREMREELGVEVEIGEPIGESIQAGAATGTEGPAEKVTGPGVQPLRLSAYAARLSAGSEEPTPRDGSHDAVAWLPWTELEGCDLAPLDVPLLVGVRRFLETPDAYLR